MKPEDFKIYKPERYLMKILIFLFILTDICLSQTITFQKTIAGSNIEYFWSVVQTPDNGYIAVGRKRISSFDYMYVVRFNPFGDTIWTKTLIGGEATYVIKTSDNNYALCGIVGHFVKFDIAGNVLASSTFYNVNSFISKILQLPNGNYLMCGSDLTGPGHPYVITLNSIGNFTSDISYTDSIYSGYFSDAVLSESSIVLTGSYSPISPLTYNIFIMKINYIGEILYCKSGHNELYVYPTGLVETNSGSFFVTGSFRSNYTFLAKYSPNGSFEWIKPYDTNFVAIPYSIVSVPDGNIVYTGIMDSSEQDLVRMRKTDTNGTEIWKTNHSIKNQDQIGYDIKLTSDSGFVVSGMTGLTQEDVYLLKTDKNGEILPPIGIEPVGNTIPLTFKLYQNYPNPFNPVTNIKLDIAVTAITDLAVFDLNGKRVQTLFNNELKPGKYIVTFNSINLSSGVYFYRLNIMQDKNKAFTQSHKLIFIK